MRPQRIKTQDRIDDLLAESWEAPTHQLEQRLNDIPGQFRLVETRKYERYVFLLNIIITSWGLGSIILFRGFLEKWLSNLASELITFNLSLGGWGYQPLFIFLALGCIGFGVWWLEMEKPPPTRFEL